MKKIIFIAAMLLCCNGIQFAGAQVRVNINIGSQPEWGPVGYDYAGYYYMPDIDAYYSVGDHQYIYYEHNNWVRATYLPARFHYDVYHGYKVVVNDRDPWLRDDVYRARYARYKGRHDQPIIRDSRDEKYQKHWDKKMEKEEKKMDKEREKEMKHDDKEWKKDHKG
jgi:hypothetical protein